MGNQSTYSRRSGKKTLIFVLALLVIVAICAFWAIYMAYQQQSVMTQSTYFEKIPHVTGSKNK